MKLYANVIGQGQPFVILHGFLGMSDNWKTIGKKIAEKGCQVHLIDQRNHGRSPHSDIFNYEVMSMDLLEYCEDHSLEDIILLGHSMGGKVAMMFSVQHPDLVDKLMVADIGPKYYPLHHQDILDGLSSLDFDELSTRGEVDKTLATYVPDIGVRMFLLKNLYWIDKGKLGLRINLKSLVSNVSEVGAELIQEFRYLGETLFLKGQKSNYILKDDEYRIRKQFPNANIVEISNAGHWLHAENPDDFLREVMNFVKN